jgi:ribosomal protein S18 acetylase RimI-like enzyme
MHHPSSAIAAGLMLAREPYADPGPQWVVAQAEAELVVRYGSLHEGELGLIAGMFDPPAGAFVVARAGAAGPPVGGVGVRALDQEPGRGEIRRLWLDPDWRGQGLARTLMLAVEEAARDLGLTALRLITGPNQPEAVALYASSGWTPDPSNSASNGFRFTKKLATSS